MNILTENYKLFNGDYLEVIKNIPDKSIDLLLTDPPYLHVKGGSKCKRFNKGCGMYSEKSEVTTKLSDFGEMEIENFLNAVKSKMKKMNCYIFCSKLQIAYYLKWVINNKKYNYDVLIWDKCRSGLIGHKSFATNIEYIIRIYENGCGLNEVKQNGKLISEYYQKIHSIKNENKKKHPAQKPEILLKRFIELSSKENDVILDCFMGSGSIGVTCMNTNRKFIGIELDENYFNIAIDRIFENYKED